MFGVDNIVECANNKFNIWLLLFLGLLVVSFLSNYAVSSGLSGLIENLFIGALFLISGIMALTQIIKSNTVYKKWYRYPDNIVKVLFLIPFFYFGIRNVYTSGLDLILNDKRETILINSQCEERRGRRAVSYYLHGIDCNGKIYEFNVGKRNYFIFGNGGSKKVLYYNRSKVVCRITDN